MKLRTALLAPTLVALAFFAICFFGTAFGNCAFDFDTTVIRRITATVWMVAQTFAVGIYFFERN